MSNSKSQFRRSSRSAIDKTTRTSNFSVVLARSAERPRRSVVSRIADRGQADLTQPALGICSVHIDKTKAHKNRIENCWPQQQCVSAMSLNFSVVDDRVNRESD
ncbi:hypothetical protein PC118_g18951 [Phytophthora cactorum]|uniref:Uncharacterized protein n=1 Tax=Phytophthora cactorum TaxID=29920 RepID=A0A8T1E3G9_9STRA|nr:hypothetical protein PC111_g18193 [Phytophthora cactorum]KAG2808077.1 hypothetical protein PC112_g17129 [Phytophthora cactorum]KAG2884120.1 hypothetical protein PC114_g20270 [Phytophthora cactorum]KAG2894685.1 hypothetical protein PC115_g18088 [Phytophthora cactorum]KAG2947997.1 hypothetical protein PC117_g6340 [Phytophthora cactorum]